MAATLRDTLLAPEVQPQVVADCEALVNGEVATMSGISGTAVKLAYKAVRTYDAGHIHHMIETLLPNLADALQPYWTEFTAAGGGVFGDYLAKNEDEVCEALLTITDERGRNSGRPVIVKAYNTVRGSAAKHVKAALPSVGALVERYAFLDDRYQLAEPIAAGGVGQVWRAADLLLDREVAVKLLRPEYADHPDTLERFRAEAKHAGSLTHPCVARVYDYGNAGPVVPPYLVMEYVDGPSLADMLAVDPVHPVVALDVAAQAAAGLDAAHRIGLVHRDIKPGNILVGADGLVKITDFGIAHVAGSAPITGPGLAMGTTQYMAPERIAGGQATPASDLYALGILIYECLTGLPPYDGGTAEVMAGHLYLPMPALPAGAPPELDELITRLTAKDPAARMSDAAEVAAIATRLRDALAVDAGLTVAAPAFAGAAPEQAGPGMTGETALLDDQPLRPLPSVPPLSFRQPGAQPHLPADRRGRTGRRRATTLAAGVTVLAGAGVAWLLASGALHDSPAADHLTVSPPATTALGGSASLAPPATGPAPSHPAAGASARPGGSATASASRQATHSPGSSPASSASPSQSSSASHSPGPSPTTTSPAPWPTLPLPLISLGL